MRRLLDTLNRHLDSRLGLTPRLLLLCAAVLVGITLLLPLWNLTMFAPQYGDGLRMDIYSHELKGGGEQLTITNIIESQRRTSLCSPSKGIQRKNRRFLGHHSSHRDTAN